MANFKNVTDRDLALPGIGIVKAGESADMPEGFVNANFKRVAPAETKTAETPKKTV